MHMCIYACPYIWICAWRHTYIRLPALYHHSMWVCFICLHNVARFRLYINNHPIFTFHVISRHHRCRLIAYWLMFIVCKIVRRKIKFILSYLILSYPHGVLNERSGSTVGAPRPRRGRSVAAQCNLLELRGNAVAARWGHTRMQRLLHGGLIMEIKCTSYFMF